MKTRIKKKTDSRLEFKDTKSNLLKSKRSQNEIAGFVMIVVIVSLIGLFLLAFYLMQKPVRTESKNAGNFLIASLAYTTACNQVIEPLNLKEVIKKCYEKTSCSDGRDSCIVLNETYSELLDETWKINLDRPVNYYSLYIYYNEPNSQTGEKEDIFSLERGNCTGSKSGGENFFHYGNGNIVSRLEICYA